MGKRLAALPSLLTKKIYKTGQTRGADDDVIYQNRVGRNSTVLIPFTQWKENITLQEEALNGFFENGYIVLIKPECYFEYGDLLLKENQLTLGENALIIYETRYEWENYPITKYGWKPAQQRESPLGGEFVARVPATTAKEEEKSKKINLGYTSSDMKGAGIRLYEYASKKTISDCKLQLEAIYWLCHDSVEVACENGMIKKTAMERKKAIIQKCKDNGLLDYKELRNMRIIDNENFTICPLCLERLSGQGFLNRLEQAEGRDVPDLTVTQVNLFHIKELRYGEYNHKAYNLGWGHHFCNVVVKDSGIYPTLKWMKDVIKRNKPYEDKF